MTAPHILVVEDHEPLLYAIRKVLERAGYSVLTATDGQKGLEVMERVRPDLIVADIMMPNMDGYEFYQAVRARPDGLTIPFIFLTARTAREDILRGKGLGAEDYLTKPFDPEELLVVVRSRLKRAEEVQQAAASEFDRLKQQIVTILSHELRTPLTYITGYTEMALEDLPSLSPSALQQFLEGIQRGSERLNRLVQDLLTVIRLDTGQAETEFRLLVRPHGDFAEVVRRTVSRYEPLAAQNDIRLEVRGPSELPPVPLCEPFFSDALGRLVENAIKFSRGKGKRVLVETSLAGEWVEVSVTDNGVGIRPEEIPHLFERFRQIDRERMEQQGVGLGLAIARELIRLHGGEITVESMYGVGSRFTIRLPLTPPS
ncbi:MAG: hybrid sensor histidine kinase/response regulator [Thermoflexales bacterium]|nr:hybrid sensor histidine kinase/response regulator [Thermoflexales bacterium]